MFERFRTWLSVLLCFCACGVLANTKNKVYFNYPVELLPPITGQIFATNVTADKLSCFGNRDHFAPSHLDVLLCIVPFVSESYCVGVWGSRSVDINIMTGSVEFLKVTHLPVESKPGSEDEELVPVVATRWLESQRGHHVFQIPAEPIYLCARSNDWRRRDSHFHVSFRHSHTRVRDRVHCQKLTLLHVGLLIAVSSANLMPYIVAAAVAAFSFMHGIKVFLTLVGFSTVVICFIPFMLTKKNRHLSKLYINHYFSHYQAEETKSVIREQWPVFQALFFSSLLMCAGSTFSYIIFYYFGLERDTRNTMLKVVIAMSISWFIFFLCRSFERFVHNWIWVVMSVCLANAMDSRINAMSREKVLIVTIIISQLVNLMLPRLMQCSVVRKFIHLCNSFLSDYFSATPKAQKHATLKKLDALALERRLRLTRTINSSSSSTELGLVPPTSDTGSASQFIHSEIEETTSSDSDDYIEEDDEEDEDSIEEEEIVQPRNQQQQLQRKDLDRVYPFCVGTMGAAVEGAAARTTNGCALNDSSEEFDCITVGPLLSQDTASIAAVDSGGDTIRATLPILYIPLSHARKQVVSSLQKVCESARRIETLTNPPLHSNPTVSCVLTLSTVSEARKLCEWLRLPHGHLYEINKHDDNNTDNIHTEVNGNHVKSGDEDELSEQLSQKVRANVSAAMKKSSSPLSSSSSSWYSSSIVKAYHRANQVILLLTMFSSGNAKEQTTESMSDSKTAANATDSASPSIATSTPPSSKDVETLCASGVEALRSFVVDFISLKQSIPIRVSELYNPLQEEALLLPTSSGGWTYTKSSYISGRLHYDPFSFLPSVTSQLVISSSQMNEMLQTHSAKGDNKGESGFAFNSEKSSKAVDTGVAIDLFQRTAESLCNTAHAHSYISEIIMSCLLAIGTDTRTALGVQDRVCKGTYLNIVSSSTSTGTDRSIIISVSIPELVDGEFLLKSATASHHIAYQRLLLGEDGVKRATLSHALAEVAAVAYTAYVCENV